MILIVTSTFSLQSILLSIYDWSQKDLSDFSQFLSPNQHEEKKNVLSKVVKPSFVSTIQVKTFLKEEPETSETLGQKEPKITN